MSYQYKKSTILFELEQAIKRKVIEKSKHKDANNKILQSSIERKKNPRQSYERPSSKPKEAHKNPSIKAEKAVSLFNNENINITEVNDLKNKKANNRKLDKLLSLINYAMSSAEKVVKFINMANF